MTAVEQANLPLNPPEQNEPKKPSLFMILRIFALLLLVAFIITFFALQLHTRIPEILEYIHKRSKSLEGVAIFFMIFLSISLLSIPISVLSIACGFIFQPLYFSLLVLLLCILLSGTLGFLMARFLLRDFLMRSLFSKNSKVFRIMSYAVETDGWKIGFLLRLSQVMPFAIGNYLLALTNLPFLKFIVTTCVGVYPGLAFVCYLGSLITDLKAVNGDGIGNSKRSSMITLTVIICCLYVTLVSLGVISRRAYRQVIQRIESEELLEENQEGGSVDQEEDIIEDGTPPQKVRFTRGERRLLIVSIVIAAVTLSISIPLIVAFNPD
ncbi:hypothetical protein MP638_000836 [Amoeboaphelidium occidentale]|nr:hypothetical protein MP638_000836 [Amoeboaphelidium occidentale]